MRSTSLGAILCLLSLTAHAGAVLKVAERDATGKSVPKEVYYAQNGMMRIDSLDSRGSVADSDVVRDGVIWRIDPQERTFTRVDQASLTGMVGGQSAEMEAMLSRLPPEKQAMMRARMAKMGQSGTDNSFTNTGRTQQSGQYSCQLWQEERSGHPVAEYCVVPATSLPAGSELAASMKQAYETATKILSGVPALAHAGDRLTRLSKMNGFPVQTRHLSQSGAAEREEVLSSAEAQSIPEDKFAIPKGYTEKPLGNL